MRRENPYMDPARAREVRFLRETQGLSTRELAARFDVGMECIRRILRWETWRHVAEVGPGATADQWGATRVEPTEAEMAAGAARLRAAVEAVTQPPAMEELMKREAERGAAQDAGVLDRLVHPGGRGEHLLRELSSKGTGDK